MRVMALFSTSFFAKHLCVVEDGPGQGHLCHTDTFLVSTVFHFMFSGKNKKNIIILSSVGFAQKVVKVTL